MTQDGFNHRIELLKCRKSAVYFIFKYVKIFSAVESAWIPFELWPSQVTTLRAMIDERLLVILKARQLGFTWLTLSFILWKMVFYPQQTIGLFSKGDREAQELLNRLRNMYDRLPVWCRTKGVSKSNAHIFELSNGSIAYALPTTGGESWTFSIVFCDEFDRFDNAQTLMINIKPTIDAGGKMIVGSISDKSKPNSIFKNIFRSAWREKTTWKALFMPWSARPDRNKEWFDGVLEDATNRHGDVNAAWDEINQQYPATPEDALSPKLENKRLPYGVLSAVYEYMKPTDSSEVDQEAWADMPPVPGLKVFVPPQYGSIYVIGADPAEGVGGDDSSACVLDVDTGEQVAVISEQLEPRKVFPAILFGMAQWYNGAGIMVERNNHGHAVIGELTELVAQSRISVNRPLLLNYPYDDKPGWLSSPSGKTVTRGKVLLYDIGASQIREKEVIVHDEQTYEQLLSIDINTLRAPSGQHDDAADAFMLACCGRTGRAKKNRFFTM